MEKSEIEKKPILPKGIRCLIFSYTSILEQLKKISKLNTETRKALLTSKLIDLPGEAREIYLWVDLEKGVKMADLWFTMNFCTKLHLNFGKFEE